MATALFLAMVCCAVMHDEMKGEIMIWEGVGEHGQNWNREKEEWR